MKKLFLTLILTVALAHTEVALSASKKWEYALWINQGGYHQTMHLPNGVISVDGWSELFDRLPGDYTKPEGAQDFSSLLNKIGVNGWEMVGCFNSNVGEKCYFKREVGP